MLSITRDEHDTPTLVKGPQPDPVFDVQGLLPHRYNHLLIAAFSLLLQVESITPSVVLLNVWQGGGRVRSEPGALLGHDCAILREEDKDEIVELCKVRGICRVLVWQLIVDRR